MINIDEMMQNIESLPSQATTASEKALVSHIRTLRLERDGIKQQMIFECSTRDEKIGRLEKELGQVQELYDLIGSIRSPEEKVSPTVPEAAIADLQEVGWELERLREQCKTAGPAMTDEEKSLEKRAMFVAMNARSTAHEVLVNDAVVVATFAQRMLESRNSWRRVAATWSAAQERRRCATICDVIAGKLERDGMVQSASHVRGCAAKIRCQGGGTPCDDCAHFDCKTRICSQINAVFTCNLPDWAQFSPRGLQAAKQEA